MPARLVSLNGRLDIDLVGVLIVVGRHHDCDVRVDSSRVSRRHCCLLLSHDEVVIRDLSSMNGTWVNGQRVEAGAALRHGDELGIAHLRYLLEITPDAGEGEGGIPT
jgi:pSer/pThr/pTyr-binding forkhead associated (FHA) protein